MNHFFHLYILNLQIKTISSLHLLVSNISDTEAFYLQTATEMCKSFGKTFTLELREKLMGLPGTEFSSCIVETLDLPVLPEEYYARSRQKIKKLFLSAKLMPGTKQNQCYYTYEIHFFSHRYRRHLYGDIFNYLF